MIAVGSVTVTVVLVVEMIAVGDGQMTAARPMGMLVPGMGEVGQWVLVVMILVRGVGVAVVDIVDMALTLDARVPAIRAVLVARVHVTSVVRVVCMVSGCHGSSLLC